MGILQFFLGAVILAAIIADVFTTTLTALGGGFVTDRIKRFMWAGALSVHQRQARPRLLTMVGPLITASVVLIWGAAMWAGWSLIFSAGATGVVDAQNGQPADAWSRIYYAGFALFTLGVGDYRPNGALWQMLTALCLANGLLTITLSITYFAPVMSAASRKRQLAASISSLGMGPRDQHARVGLLARLAVDLELIVQRARIADLIGRYRPGDLPRVVRFNAHGPEG